MPSRLGGWRSDHYAAMVELCVALCVGLVGALELYFAVEKARFALSDPRPYLIPKSQYAFERVAFAGTHCVPALVLFATAIGLKRRDPFTRPLVAASIALALGSAHVASVMGFIGAPLALVGFAAMVFALRPNGAAAIAGALLGSMVLLYGTVLTDAAVQPALLALSRGSPRPVDRTFLLQAVASAIAAPALLVLSLSFRRPAPDWIVRRRTWVVALSCLPASSAIYWLLVALGLPISA
jgi:hypothetical protein